MDDRITDCGKNKEKTVKSKEEKIKPDSNWGVGEISCVLSCVFLHLGSYIMHLGITHMERSKELTQLGIVTIGVSIVTEMVAAIVYENMSYILVSTDSLEISNWGSVGIGIAFIIVSLICRYGAESGREQ